MAQVATTKALGSELAVGDVVFSNGYRFQIDKVAYDPMHGHRLGGDLAHLGRWYVHCHAIGDNPLYPCNDLPSLYRDAMEMALREDLHWCKEVPA